MNHLHTCSFLPLARRAAAVVFWPIGAAAWAQTAPVPQGVLNLTASATVEVAHDWMSVALGTSREGSDAAAVQQQLKVAVDAALAEARKVARPGQLEVQTGAFSIYPRYGTRGNMTGWQGQAEVLLQGRDMAAIAQLSGRISSLTIARVSQGLSREAREKSETEVAGQAVARFRARAADLAKQFGYAGYSLREVNLSADAPPVGIMPAARSAVLMNQADGGQALPVEAGKATVTATVTGSVQMK